MATKNEPQIYEALSSILDEVDAIGKDKRNTQQNFMYRGIDDMYNALHPLFAKHKVFVVPEVQEVLKREERTSKNGGLLLWTMLKVKFTFYHADGSQLSAVTVGEAMDSADKGSNKAISVALKYCLINTFLIPTKDQDDADSIHPEVEPHQTRTQQPAADQPPAKKRISPDALNKAVQRIRRGETDLRAKMEEAFNLSASDRQAMNDAANAFVLHGMPAEGTITADTSANNNLQPEENWDQSEYR